MSYEVQHAFWHFWQPGEHVEISEGEADYTAYASYVRKAGRRNSDQRLFLLALAFDANAIPDVHGEAHMAMCFTAIDTLAERIQRSRSTVKRLFQEMERWGDIQVSECDGTCLGMANGRRHAGTHHFYLSLPREAAPWGRKTKGQMQRGRTKNSQRR